MKQIRSQPLRCPLCERGRIIDAGPMARVSQFNINIDYCGIRNLLLALLDNGFTEAEIKKIAARISANCGADIIVF